MNARKWPAAKHFLGTLVDIDDDDARIGRDAAAELKPGVERVQFQPVDGVKYRHRAFADEGGEVHAEGDERDDKTDDQRAAMAPPFTEKFCDGACFSLSH